MSVVVNLEPVSEDSKYTKNSPTKNYTEKENNLTTKTTEKTSAKSSMPEILQNCPQTRQCTIANRQLSNQVNEVVDLDRHCE